MAINWSVQPPAWLQRDAQPADTTTASKDVGWALGGAINSVTQGEDFQSGLADARKSMADPLWKIHEQQMQTKIKGELGDIEAQHALAVQRNQQSEGWLRNAPATAKWMALPFAEQLVTPPPPSDDEKSMKIIEAKQIANQRTKEQMDGDAIKLLGVQNRNLETREAANLSADFTKRLGALSKTTSPEISAEAAALRDPKMRYPAGSPYAGTPLPEAVTRLAAAEQKFAQEQKAAKDAAQEAKFDFRREMEAARQVDRVAVKQMELDSKTVGTKEAFIQKNEFKLAAMMRKGSATPEDSATTLAKAQRMLGLLYDQPVSGASTSPTSGSPKTSRFTITPK